VLRAERNTRPDLRFDSGIEVYSDSGYTTLITSSTVSISNGSFGVAEDQRCVQYDRATVYIRAILATKAGYAMSTNLSATSTISRLCHKSAVELSSSGLGLFNSMIATFNSPEAAP